jgi:CDP-diglyceride synthetase
VAHRFTCRSAHAGFILGNAIAILAPMGDFGESMIKRQFNIKTRQPAFPAMGFFDRIEFIPLGRGARLLLIVLFL